MIPPFSDDREKERFYHAVRDYRMLLDSGYPEKQIQTLVGDRYRLPSLLRRMLYRGIFSTADSRERSCKIIEPDRIYRAQTLFIDTFNILFTCLHYLQGLPLFLSTDSLVRDTGENHGHRVHPDRMRDITAGLILYLNDLGFEDPLFVIDTPVGNSGRLRSQIEDARCRTEMVISADNFILCQKEGTAATADSALISRLAIPVTDLARAFLEETYGAQFFNLNTLVQNNDIQ